MKRHLETADKTITGDNDSDCKTSSATISNSTAVNKLQRLGKCEVCAANEARYACPKCEVKTCCVACVQIHKKELDCDGIRDRTKFVALREMTSMDFMSDYYFLEEATRFVQDRKDDKIKRITRFNKTLPPRLFYLRQAAQNRGIKLQFLVQNFTRHNENTSYYDNKEKKIYWRIEWIFVNAGSLKYVDDRCAEDVPLQKLLDKYLNPKSLEQVPQKKSLEYYQSVSVYKLKVLLKAEGVQRAGSRFYSLDVCKNLKENLARKHLIEFPTIYISYEHDSAAFDIIDSDEDVETEARNYQTTLEKEYREKITALAQNELVASGDECCEQKKLSVEENKKRKDQKKQKCEDYKNSTNNFLFTDEKLMEMLSSDDELEN